MIKQVNAKIKTHTSGSLNAFVLMFVASMTASYTYDSTENTIQRIASTDFYYTYESVEIVSDIEKGGSIELHSVNEIKRPITITWYDTAFCELEDKTVRKLQTQEWTDRPQVGKSTPEERWYYTEEPVPDDAISCKVCGEMYGLTTQGHKKPYDYCTEWQNVIK